MFITLCQHLIIENKYEYKSAKDARNTGFK